MALSQSEIQILLKAQDEASASIQKVHQELGTLGQVGAGVTSQLSGVGSTLLGIAASAAAFAGISVGFSSVIGAASSFEAQMSAVGAVSGATGKEMDQLSDYALKLGEDTSFSALQAGKGLEELAKAGVTTEEILGGAGAAALNLAAAGAVSVADAAEIASNAMNVFGKKGADMAHVADIISGAANASAIGVNDYKFSLSAAGAVAATVGVSFEELSTAIAEMGNAGIKGSDAGTSLKTFLLNLTPSTEKAKEEMMALGIITSDGANRFFDASGKVKSLADVSQILQDATSKLTQEQKLQALQTMFGTDAIRTSAVFATKGAKGFNDLADAMGAAGGAAEVANKRLDNFSGSVELLSGSWSTFVILLGKMFLPVLKHIVDQVNVFVGSATQILKKIPDAWRTVLQAFDGQWKASDTLDSFINMAGKAGIAARQFFDLFSGNISVSALDGLRTSLEAIIGPTATALLMNFGQMAGEVWRTVAAVAQNTLVPAFEGIREGIGRLVEFAQTLPAPFWVGVAAFAAVVLGAGPLITVLGTIASTLGLLLVPLAALVSPLGVVALAVAGLAAVFTANFDLIKGRVGDLVTVAAPLLDSFGAILKLALGGHVTEAVDLFLSKIREVAPAIATVISNWAQEFAQWAPGAIQALLSRTGEFVAGVVKWLGDAVASIDWTGVWNKAVNVISGIAKWFVDLGASIASWIGIQVAFVDWGKVWDKAVDVVSGMAKWFVDLTVSLTKWIGERVAEIPWDKVWANTKGATEAIQKAMERESTKVDWTKVIQANHDAATQLGQGISKIVTDTDWDKVGRGLGQLLAGAITNAFRLAWGLIQAAFAFTEPILALLVQIEWSRLGIAFGQLLWGMFTEGWRIAIAAWRPAMPAIVIDFVGFINGLSAQIRNALVAAWTWATTGWVPTMSVGVNVQGNGAASAQPRPFDGVYHDPAAPTPVTPHDGRSGSPQYPIYGNPQGSGQSQARAVGGEMLPNQDYLVGEQGPERVRVGSVARIESAQATRALDAQAGGGGGISISVVVADGAVQVTGASDRGLGQRVGDTISLAIQALLDAEGRADFGVDSGLAGAF